MITVIGLVNSANQWVGGAPQVVYNAVPSQSGSTGTATWSNLAVPSSAGTYQLWFQTFLTANTSLSISSFESSPPTVSGYLSGIVATVVVQGSGAPPLSQWQAIGPTAIPQSSGPTGAGKLQAFAVDLANPQVMYAGGGTGPGSSGPSGQAGIFKTIDGGNTWTNINTGLTDPMVDVLWLDQANPSIVLAGTWFGGIFRSTDAGVHWVLQTNLGSTTAFLQVGQPLYAATASGVAESTDAGATWSVVEPTSVPVRALATSGSALYAGLDDGEVLSQSSSWQTVLSDSGHTVWSLAVDPTSTQTVYAVEWDNYEPDLFVTTNSGGTWSALLPPGYNNAVQVVAVNASGAVFAGFDYIGDSLYVSTNKGATWAGVPDGPWDVRFLLLWPGQLGKIVLGSDQGLYMTTDEGGAWSGLNGHITSSLLTGLAVNGSTIFSAVQDYSPIYSYDAGATWQLLSGSAPPVGEDGIVRINPSNSNYVYAYTDVGFQYSMNGGLSFDSASAIQFTFAGAHNLIAVDPANPSTVYVVANNGIFKSTDWGVSRASLPWSFTSSSLIVVNPKDSQTIFVGTQGAGLSVTHNGGTTWTPCNLGGAAGYPYALDIDPSNTNVVYVGMTSTPNGGGGVLLSTNGGSNFASDNTGLNSTQASFSGSYVLALGFNAASTNGMAALATANGIYLSATPGATWTDISGNAIPKLFTDLAWVGNDLYAATYGEGVILLANAGLPFLSVGSPPLTPNGFSLSLHGLIGAHYAIQASTDLILWQTITSFTSTNSLVNFSDPAITSYNHRFYRAKLQ